MNTMNEQIDAHTRAEIEALVVKHAWLQDGKGEAAELAELYTPDGRLYGIGPELCGASDLIEYAKSKVDTSGNVTRHVCTNLLLERRDERRITGRLIITLFRHRGSGVGASSPCAIADAVDVYVKGQDEKWKIEERRLELIFESAANRRK